MSKDINARGPRGGQAGLPHPFTAVYLTDYNFLCGKVGHTELMRHKTETESSKVTAKTINQGKDPACA